LVDKNIVNWYDLATWFLKRIEKKGIRKMKKMFFRFAICIVLIPVVSLAQAYKNRDGKIKVYIVKNNSEGPRVMAEGGLEKLLKENTCIIEDVKTVELTPEEQRQYGEWNQDALESKNMGKLISANRKNDYFTIGLLTNCVDLLGMLAGLQHLRPEAGPSKSDFRSLQNEGLAGRKPFRIGLIYIDAHADFNTPETTLSGMLGGMNVAVASGLCLTRLRLKTGLDPAIPTKYIVMGGLRDVDPLEQELLDRSFIEYISVDDIRNLSDNITFQMERLSRLTDMIYIHIDMDVLDPSEVSGHPLTAPEGPTSKELAAALEKMFRFEKTTAIGIASLPFGENDKELRSLKAAYNLIEGAIKGVLER
jgi:arginase